MVELIFWSVVRRETKEIIESIKTCGTHKQTALRAGNVSSKVEVVQDLYIWLAEEIVQVFWNSHRAKHGETSAIWNYPDTGLKIVLSTRSYKLFWTWNVLILISPTILIGVDEFPVRNIWTMHFLLWKLVFDVITFHLGRHFGEASKAHAHFNVLICLW